MKDVEFITGGYLSKDYFAKVAADLGWRLRPGESSDEVWVDDEKGGTLGTIYLNEVGPDGSVIYAEDSDDILQDLEKYKKKMANPVENGIDFFSDTYRFPEKLFARISLDHPEMYSWIEGERRLHPYVSKLKKLLTRKK